MEDLDLKFKFKGMDKLPRLMEIVPDITREEMAAAATEGTLLLERETKEYTPVGVGGAASGLAGSITAKPVSSFSKKILGVVSTSSPHAIPVELGTKPHWAPIEPLKDWVVAKLGIRGEEEVFGVARAIQRKIASRGTVAVGMFHRAFNENKSQLQRIYERALDRIEDRMVPGV